jgi:hypothetical protein
MLVGPRKYPALVNSCYAAIANLRSVQVVPPNNVLSVTPEIDWSKMMVSINRTAKTHDKPAMTVSMSCFRTSHICSNTCNQGK